MSEVIVESNHKIATPTFACRASSLGVGEQRGIESAPVGPGSHRAEARTGFHRQVIAVQQGEVVDSRLSATGLDFKNRARGQSPHPSGVPCPEIMVSSFIHSGSPFATRARSISSTADKSLVIR